MANRSREKSYRCETASVAKWQTAGFKAKRARGSDGRSIGKEAGDDYVVNAPGIEFTVQQKARKALPKWTDIDGSADIVELRPDRKPSVYLVPEAFLFDLLRAL